MGGKGVGGGGGVQLFEHNMQVQKHEVYGWENGGLGLGVLPYIYIYIYIY